MDYTSNQQRAIDHWDGNLQIIACADSGKTDLFLALFWFFFLLLVNGLLLLHRSQLTCHQLYT